MDNESKDFSKLPKEEPKKDTTPMSTVEQVSDSELNELATRQPMPVIKNYSVRGIEYLFMSICLWFGAAGLIWILVVLINGLASSEALGFSTTSLVVTLPIFAWFFLRLKKAELADPRLKFDPSKRRLSQITQTLAFLTSLINVIVFVYSVFVSFSSETPFSIGKAFLSLLAVLVVAGGILAYYWNDEHRSFKK